LARRTTGIRVRHARSCPGKPCRCTPTYEAWVWSRKDGKKIRETFPTISAAKSWRSDALGEVRRGQRRAPTSETVRQAGGNLIEGMRDGSIRDRSGKRYKPSTIRSYEASLEGRIYPAFGARKLSSLTYPDLQDWVDELAADGLDGSTIRNNTMPLRVLYRRARYQIPLNPTTGLEIVAAGNKPRRIVTPDVGTRMIAAVPLEERALRATAFLAGLRNGELQALQIDDIELFEQGRWGLINVQAAWDRMEGAQGPKSLAGMRTVPVCSHLYEILDEHLLRLGWSEGLAFGRSPTRPYSYAGARDRASRAYAKAGLEPSDLQLHECRHSFSSWLAAAGIPRERRDRYRGHVDNSMDARYTHQLDHQYLDDARALSDYLQRADTEGRMRTGAHTGAQKSETAESSRN
jgi:integrase